MLLGTFVVETVPSPRRAAKTSSLVVEQLHGIVALSYWGLLIFNAGAKIRSSVMSLLHTVKKRLTDQTIEAWLTNALNKISLNPDINIASLIPQ